MKRRGVRKDGHSFEGINATPLIDVVMCLITFFLLVGKLAADKGAMLRLPETRVGEVEKAADVVVVTISGRPVNEVPGSAKVVQSGWPAGVPAVAIDERPIPDAATLELVIRTRLMERPKCVLQVRAERDLSYGAVQPVLAAVARAGATTVRLAMERAQ